MCFSLFTLSPFIMVSLMITALFWSMVEWWAHGQLGCISFFEAFWGIWYLFRLWVLLFGILALDRQIKLGVNFDINFFLMMASVWMMKIAELLLWSFLRYFEEAFFSLEINLSSLMMLFTFYCFLFIFSNLRIYFERLLNKWGGIYVVLLTL